MKLKVTNIPVFPCILTQITFDNFDEIKGDLVKWIYNFKSHNPTVYKSNQGGWQSESDFYKTKSFKPFYDYIIESIKSSLPYRERFVIQNMWINVNGKNHRNELHNHPGATISGVFWIQCDENSGPIIFQSPFIYSQDNLYFYRNFSLNDMNYQPFIPFFPKEGVALMFPSELLHYVESNKSDKDRISISFNLKVNSDFYGEPE